MAAAQTAPSAKPAAAQQPSASTPVSAAAVPASLSPQQQRLLDEADQLLTLAQELKTEVGKTDQYTLSLNTLRRAGDIEKLAKTLEKEVQRENR